MSLNLHIENNIPYVTNGTSPAELGKVETVVISVIVTALLALMVGGLIGAAIMYFVMKKNSQNQNSSDNKAGTLYEEVAPSKPAGTIEMEENVSYGPVKCTN